MTPSSRITTVAADGRDEQRLAEAAAGPIVAVAVPVVRVDGDATVAEGVPDLLSLAAGFTPGGPISLTLDGALATRHGFTGKEAETLVVPTASDRPSVVFVGCGDDGSVDAETLRKAAAAAVRGAARSGAALFLLPASLAEAAAGEPGATAHRRGAQAVAEGAILAGYRYLTYKSEDSGERVERVVIAGLGLDEAALAEGVRRGTVVADAVCLARDLVNEPPSSMTPSAFARIAGEQVATRQGVTLEIWDEARIEAERLGGLLGVARGSAEPPRLLIARYEPDVADGAGPVPHVALVGKGITFDSGGLSLKSADGMMTMKTDMSGAAAVLATVSACGDLGVRTRVTAITPVTENMPGGRATKPGDVLPIRNGKTIEVLNTDAEGRLVLADGLSLAAEMHPDAVVDVATLTGACVVALGQSIAGVLGNDEGLITRLRDASARAGESIWPLPLARQYRNHIDSDVADMKNVGKAGQAGAISAALLLERFVDDVPWAHLDIAGPARSDEDSGVLTKGGTGFAVRTLLELLQDYGAGAGD
jgi:leucyl aminopeptidase